MTTEKGAGGEFLRDVVIEKPGIVGARWWHQGLVDEEKKMSRRAALGCMALAGGALAALSAAGAGIYHLTRPEATSLGRRDALPMQKTYGWDFGARGVPLVFDGIVQGPFQRHALGGLATALSPRNPAHAKHHVPTLVESLLATPTATLPDPEDGLPRPDSGPFKRLADVIVPISTPEMDQAYEAGVAFARLGKGRAGLAALADLPGHQAVAFAAGAASTFEPVLLLDNWPHPRAVVPSHLTLAALAYYQPRFEAQKAARGTTAPPLFVLDRMRLAPYAEESERFDNRYYARMPKLETLGRDGVRTLFYVVASPASLPEPDDLNAVLAAPPVTGQPAVEVRAMAVTDFRRERSREGATPSVYYGGSPAAEATFFTRRSGGGDEATPSASHEHVFVPRTANAAARPRVGTVPVVVTASGLVLAAALDRRGSMNRFAGGWSG